jgi:hypothetical protein
MHQGGSHFYISNMHVDWLIAMHEAGEAILFLNM